MNRPWFKAYAADYILDSKIDAIPPEAEGLVWRMWCICHMDGSCPADPAELARKIRRPIEYVLKYKSYYESLFDLKGTSYVSRRMEKEHKRSQINRENVLHRYSSVEKTGTSTVCSTNGNSDGKEFVLPPSDSDSSSVLDLDLQVFAVAQLHPGIGDPKHLSHEYQTAIAEAIIRHGDKVLTGTTLLFEACAKTPGLKKFLRAVSRYYRNSDYLLDPPTLGDSRIDGWVPPQNAPADYVPESVKRTRELAARKAQGL